MTLRVGSKPPHQTIYDEDDRMIGVGITPEDAAWIVEQVNAAERVIPEVPQPPREWIEQFSATGSRGGAGMGWQEGWRAGYAAALNQPEETVDAT